MRLLEGFMELTLWILIISAFYLVADRIISAVQSCHQFGRVHVEYGQEHLLSRLV